MKALISPLEPRQGGYRLAWVEEKEYDVAEPMFWIDCADDIMPDQFYYDPADETIKVLTETNPYPFGKPQGPGQGTE